MKKFFIKKLIFFFVFSYCFLSNLSSQVAEVKIYLIPGIGSDYRIFEKINPKGNYDTVYIHYPEICKKCSMKEYSEIIVEQIDTTEKFILIGVSLGGMISTEIASKYNADAIIISSAKCRDEIAFRYRFQKQFPLYRIFPKRLIKMSSFIAQRVVEPDRKNNKKTFDSMLKDKEPLFMKQTIRMVACWERESYGENIYHIHGNNDKTLPIRNIKYDYLIENGSHMMVLTRGDEINTIIEEILNKINEKPVK